MLTCAFNELELSRLGFGAMRLPLLENGAIDEAQTQQMIDYALEQGVNYFDTAYPYHDGMSEIITARCLRKHPRDSYFLANKYPGHQIAPSYDPAAIFEEQLAKCEVDYFDFYLLHNVYENSIKTYTDPQWGILDYFCEQKRLGRIRHLGFSTHGLPQTIEAFLDYAEGKMEFAQIQLNYLDWTLQDARRKCAILQDHEIPIWVMEGIRGGTLAKLNDENTARLNKLRPNESPAAWALQWLINQPVGVILSGMSNIEQLQENIRVFESGAPLDANEEEALLDVAESMKDDIPCTACRYCIDQCPQGLDIPMLLALYNDMRVAPNFTTNMIIEALDEDKRPDACVACNACVKMCPQKIDIPTHLNALALTVSKMPSWAELSRKREEIASQLRKN